MQDTTDTHTHTHVLTLTQRADAEYNPRCGVREMQTSHNRFVHGRITAKPITASRSLHRRAASFVHSPLLPTHTAGTVATGLISLADWCAR